MPDAVSGRRLPSPASPIWSSTSHCRPSRANVAAPCWQCSMRGACVGCCTGCSTRMSSSALRYPFAARPFHRDHPFSFQVGDWTYCVGYHGRHRIQQLRRQLELAWPDVDADQPADCARATQPAPLLRRELQGRMSDRLRPAAYAARGLRGDRPPDLCHFPAWARRKAPALWRHQYVPDRPALARPDPSSIFHAKRRRPRPAIRPLDRRRVVADDADPLGGLHAACVVTATATSLRCLAACIEASWSTIWPRGACRACGCSDQH